MITAATVMWDCFAMEHALLSARGVLPPLAGVYIVYRGDDVLYVGQTQNLSYRWHAHHRRQEFAAFGDDVSVAWRALPTMAKRDRLIYEFACILHLKPQCNRRMPSASLRQHAAEMLPPVSLSLLQREREKAHLTIGQLAVLAHMRFSTIWKIERGQRKLFDTDIAQLADAIGCSIEALIPVMSETNSTLADPTPLCVQEA